MSILFLFIAGKKAKGHIAKAELAKVNVMVAKAEKRMWIEIWVKPKFLV